MFFSAKNQHKLSYKKVSNTLLIAGKIEVAPLVPIRILLPDFCKDYTFASSRQFVNKPRDKNRITNYDKLKLTTIVKFLR